MTIEQHPGSGRYTLTPEEAALVRTLVDHVSREGNLSSTHSTEPREPSKRTVELAKGLLGRFSNVETDESQFGNLAQILQYLPSYSVTIKVRGPRLLGTNHLSAEYTGYVTDIKPVGDTYTITLSDSRVVKGVEDWNLFELYRTYSTSVQVESNEDV